MKKNTKKRNDKTIFIVAVILFAMATGLFVGAYARFQTSVTGTASLTTATWSFQVNGSTSNFEVDLMEGTVYNTVTVGVGTDAVQKIQPGSYGQFDLNLSAVGSEVDVTYDATFGSLTGNKVPTNLALYSDNTYTTELSNVTGDVITAGTTKKVTVYWKWLWTTNDDNEFSGQSLSLPITITGYQVDPDA